LFDPRPNNDIEVGEGYVYVKDSNVYQNNSMNPAIVGSNFVVDEMTGSVGEVTITL
jgi:hypothetical protein